MVNSSETLKTEGWKQAQKPNAKSGVDAKHKQKIQILENLKGFLDEKKHCIQ